MKQTRSLELGDSTATPPAAGADVEVPRTAWGFGRTETLSKAVALGLRWIRPGRFRFYAGPRLK